METASRQADITFLEEFEELFNENWRNIVFYGGRGSGKSQHAALALVLTNRLSGRRMVRRRVRFLRPSVHRASSGHHNGQLGTCRRLLDESWSPEALRPDP